MRGDYHPAKLMSSMGFCNKIIENLSKLPHNPFEVVCTTSLSGAPGVVRPLVSVVVNVIVVTFPERLICKVMAEHVSERLGSSERVEGI